MEMPKDAKQRVAEIDAELSALEDRRSRLLNQLSSLQQQPSIPRHPDLPTIPIANPTVTNQSPQEEKIRLFRSLFRWREDVFPRRYESTKPEKRDAGRSAITNGLRRFDRNPGSPALSAALVSSFCSATILSATI